MENRIKAAALLKEALTEIRDIRKELAEIKNEILFTDYYRHE